MTKENTKPESRGSVTGGRGKGHSNSDDNTFRHATRPLSKQSEAIIKEVSVRRRTAMKVLANR